MIHPRVVMGSSSSIEKPLCNLINIVISRSQAPDIWKYRHTTPQETQFLYKRAKKKVLERLTYFQMAEHFQPIFRDFVFLYRKFHGCPLALRILTLIEMEKGT